MCRKACCNNSRHESVKEIQGLFTFCIKLWLFKNFIRHFQNTGAVKTTNKPNPTAHLFIPTYTLRSFQHNLDHELVLMTQ